MRVPSAGPPDSVIARVGVLLDAFELDAAELGLNELARRTGLPKATVYRLASKLVDERLLERSGANYRLGSRLFELGQRVPRRRLLRDTSLPFLEDLFVATRETVHLAVVDGTQVLYLERIAGHRSTMVPSHVAGRMPMHCTATGKALLAFSGDELMGAVLAGRLARRTAFTITAGEVLAAEVARVRKEGVAFEREETRLGVGSVAAPVFGHLGDVVAAVSVTGPTSRVDLDIVAPTVRTVARGLTRTLQAAVHDELADGRRSSG